jgi:hypothetical protein
LCMQLLSTFLCLRTQVLAHLKLLYQVSKDVNQAALMEDQGIFPIV